MQSEPTTQYFCLITINYDVSMIIECVMIVLSVILIGDAIRKFWKMRGSHNSHVTKMYMLILLWWGTFVAGSVFAIVMFIVSKNKTSGEMSDFSKYSFVMNWVNAYFIQSLLLLVPYHWGKQITDLFSQAERGSQVVMEDPKEYRGLEKKIYLTLKIYMILRFLSLGLPFYFIIESELGIIKTLFKIMISALLLDCVFITLSLIIGMISLKTTKELKQQIDEDQSKRMINQYLMIILANTIRFAFDLYYVLSVFDVISEDSFVSNECPSKQVLGIGVQLAFNIGTSIFSHYLPIFIILRIYNLEEKPEEMCKSLLITTSES